MIFSYFRSKRENVCYNGRVKLFGAIAIELLLVLGWWVYTYKMGKDAITEDPKGTGALLGAGAVVWFLACWFNLKVLAF